VSLLYSAYAEILHRYKIATIVNFVRTYYVDRQSCALAQQESYRLGQKNAKDCYKILKGRYMESAQYMRFLNKDFKKR
jgi:predicted nucleic-acid-binding protein